MPCHHLIFRTPPPANASLVISPASSGSKFTFSPRVDSVGRPHRTRDGRISQPARATRSNSCHIICASARGNNTHVADSYTFDAEADEEGQQEESVESLEEDDLVSTTKSREPDEEEETMELLEWGRVCEQVSRFADTPMGYHNTLAGRLGFGHSRQESEKLLAQTSAALELPRRLSFEGAEGPGRVLARAVQGERLAVAEFGQVKKLIECFCSLRQQLKKADEMSDRRDSHAAGVNDPRRSHSSPLSPLIDIVSWGEDTPCTLLVSEMKRCFNFDLNSVRDEASESLAEVRHARRDNARQLDAELGRIAREDVVAKGGFPEPLVTRRRGRLCVAVRAGSKNTLLPGGVTLEVSNSGATAFVEPKEAIERNNREAELSEREAEEEERVVEGLAEMLAEAEEEVAEVGVRVMQLDLACARARHALWMGGVRPWFTDEHGSDGTHNRVDILGMRHPLLLGSFLDSSEGGIASTPVPLDIVIREGVTVVAITGPNAGGKTSTLKALGLAALMARAGLFLPASNKGSPPLLPWFEHVLADIGDEQSLEHSLSTFSGHIRRISRILRFLSSSSSSCSSSSSSTSALVLLDEVCSGTDPAEGALLASSILQHLAACSSSLTLATTHYAELRDLKSNNGRYENACVEFDPLTLRPTFRLLWGQSGQSNAFFVAANRGIPASVLERAHELQLSFDSVSQLPNGRNESEAVSEGLHARQPPSGKGREDDGDLLFQLMTQRSSQREKAEAAMVVAAAAHNLLQRLRLQTTDLEGWEVLQRRKLQKTSEGKAKWATQEADAEILAFCEAMSALYSGNSAPLEDDDLTGKDSGSGGGAQVLFSVGEESKRLLNETISNVERIRDHFCMLREKSEGGSKGQERGVQLSVDSAALLQLPGSINGQTLDSQSLRRKKVQEANKNVQQQQQQWSPSQGDRVIVPRLGTTPATVIGVGAEGEEVTVQLGRMKLSVRANEVLPSGGGNTSVRMTRREEGRESENAQSGGLKQIAAAAAPLKFEAAVQMRANSLDLRGSTVQEAVERLDLEIGRRPRGSVLFVVHGLGSGAIKDAVQRELRRNRRVAKFEQESPINAGCTIVFLQ